jgi:hypothetical protein
MSIRIGELLVQRGAINDAQLQRALNAQLVYGGHLGTCLIEQGFLSEDDLGQALSDIYGFPYATVAIMQDIPGPVIECVPRKIVEKHCVVPLRIDNGILDVAMIDPKNIHGLDETAFATGLKTNPWVAPEIRIFQAMERYYGVPRRLRFIALCRELDREQPFNPSTDAEIRSTSRPNEPLKPEDSGQGIGSSTGSETRVNRGLEDLGTEFGYGRSWRDVVGEDEPGEPAMTAVAAAPSHPASPPAPTTIQVPPTVTTAPPVKPALPPMTGVSVPSLDEVADRMCRSESLAQLSCALLDYAAVGTPRCILWGVDGTTASIWDQRGFGLTSDTARMLRLQVTEEPMFRLVAGAGCYRGPVPADPSYHGHFHQLGASVPAEILVLPIYLNDHLVALFYGDSGDYAGIQVETEHYRRAMIKLAYSFTLLQLKQKIRSV